MLLRSACRTILMALMAASCASMAAVRCGAQEARARFDVVDRLAPTKQDLVLAASLGQDSLSMGRTPEFDALPRARQIDVLRAGLRLSDGRGRLFCAMNLSRQYLDTWEQRRSAKILLDAIIDLATVPLSSQTAISNEAFRQTYYDIVDAANALNQVARPSDFVTLLSRLSEDSLYKQLLIEICDDLPIDSTCVPSILQAMENRDPELMNQLCRWLHHASRFHGVDIAPLGAALWKLTGRLPQDSGLSEDVNSTADHRLSLWLRRALQVVVLEQHDVLKGGRILSLIANCLAKETPGAQDLTLLLEVAHSLRASLRAMRNLVPDRDHGDPVIMQILRNDREIQEVAVALVIAWRAIDKMRGVGEGVDWKAACDSEDGDPYVFALAGMAATGDREAEALLSLKASDSLLALAVMLDRLPELARQHVAALIDSDAIQLLYRSEGDWPKRYLESHASAYQLQWGPEQLGALSKSLLSPKTSLSKLRKLFLNVFGFRTHEVASEIISRLEAAAASGTALEEIEFTDAYQSESDEVRILAALEGVYPDRVRAVLRHWGESHHQRDRDFACNILLRMGDPLAGPLLVSWIRERCGWLKSDYPVLVLLMRSDGPEVRKFLESLPNPWDLVGVSGLHTYLARDVRNGDGLRALAIIRGLPAQLATQLPIPSADAASGHDAADEKLVRNWKRLRDGDAQGALLPILAWHSPDGESKLSLTPQRAPSLGGVDHPSVWNRLTRMREQRESGQYWWATGQLALLGLAEARAEIHAARMHQHIIFCDVADASALLVSLYPEGMEQAVTSWLADPGEPNAAFIVGELTDLAKSPANFDLLPHKPMHRRIFDRSTERLHWSLLVGKFIVVPR